MKNALQILVYLFVIIILTYDFYGSNELYIEKGIIGLIAFLFIARSIFSFDFKFGFKLFVEIMLDLFILLLSCYGFYLFFALWFGYGFTGKDIPVHFTMAGIANLTLFIMTISSLFRLGAIPKSN